jgi:vacuolar protein sorting-associated protein 1
MLGQIYSSISDLLVDNEENILQNKKLINIANKLSSLFTNKSIKIPQLVVVGTQSSGKSSLINGILNMNILPTGKNMVTRTPIKLELLYHSESTTCIQFGNYEHSVFKKHKEFVLKGLTENTESTIRENIESFTKTYAGNEKGISFKEIVIKITSSDVPNLTLIDLPGLVMVACTDQGQPEDIKNQIKDLIKHYIIQENTIIMGILPARCDIEVDSALELIKEYDNKGTRTIGIMTKIDLMNENTDIGNYLKNEISNDLKLNYGYFAIKNKNNNEISYKEHNKLESQYFNNHPVYSQMEKNNMGIINLSIYLSNILLNEIKLLIPTIHSQLMENLLQINNELNKLGNHINIDDNNKNFVLNLYISNFIQDFRESLENYSHSLNYGKQIKDIFVNYRTNLSNVDPLKNINDTKLNEIIKDSEGNHMYYQTSTIQILEKCLIDNKIKSIHTLKNPSLTCLEFIYNLLIQIINDLLKLDNYSKYPHLKILILQKSTDLINYYKDIVINKINELINTEEAYIWTESDIFRTKFKEIGTIENCSVDNIKNIIYIYFDTVIDTFKNHIPKVIMLNMIKNVQNNLSHILTKDIENDTIINLLQEDNTIHNKRLKLLNEKKGIEDIKELINSI